ncbi:MAG: dihydrodipicolinate synthase family protein [Clostridia bacterium]|nr:dihydrodipicolinate synthase family protein [Clostridia bacterium]
MNKNEIAGGVYPTMITPYTKENGIDYDAVNSLVDFYKKSGCSGIFGVCQSSEMFYLSLKERICLAKATVDAAKKCKRKMNVVVSGHISNNIEAQAEELTAIFETGADAAVLVSNRLDLHNDGDRVWISNAEKLLKLLPENMPLGIYECPYPYKRFLSKEILDWCKKSGRFRFIKDTCCDPEMLKQRINQLKGSGLKLFNANSQTLLYTLNEGCDGYSGIMANFHPGLYVWLCENYRKYPDTAKKIQALLSMTAFTEVLSYPSTAKYYLNGHGIGSVAQTV